MTIPLVWGLALAFLCMGAGWQVEATGIVQADSKAFPASVDTAKDCPKLRIAIINGVSFHFEVLAGILHVLKPYESSIDVFMSPWIKKENYDGQLDHMGACSH